MKMMQLLTSAMMVALLMSPLAAEEADKCDVAYDACTEKCEKSGDSEKCVEACEKAYDACQEASEKKED
jgi:hypothetical protein